VAYICVVFSFLSFVSDSKAKIKVPSVESGGRSCLSTVVLARFLNCFR
jgi:hypothetical protein